MFEFIIFLALLVFTVALLQRVRTLVDRPTPEQKPVARALKRLFASIEGSLYA